MGLRDRDFLCFFPFRGHLRERSSVFPFKMGLRDRYIRRFFAFCGRLRETSSAFLLHRGLRDSYFLCFGRLWEKSLAFLLHMGLRDRCPVFFAFRKCEDRGINIYDSCLQTYVDCESIDSLPLFSPNIIKILNKYVKKVGHIKIIKTSMRPGYKGLSVSTELDKKHPYKNIKTCILNKLDPKLVINYSNKPCSFSGVEKLVLAHKMYGFPYYDKGEYGISNRDNYVIIDTTVELKRIKRFLETDLAFVAYEAARYRMKYLERYAFEFLPDINLLDGFPDDITNESVNDYFKFNGLERMCIKDTRKKRYCTF